MPDYLAELKTITEGSFLEELDGLNLEVEYRRAVQNSIGYMLLVRCGLDPSEYFEDEDFRDVTDFNTPQTLNALGVAAGDISQMCLSAISRTVLALQRQPKKENRTFETQPQIQYAVTEQENTQPALQTLLTNGKIHIVQLLSQQSFHLSVHLLPYKRKPKSTLTAYEKEPHSDVLDHPVIGM